MTVRPAFVGLLAFFAAVVATVPGASAMPLAVAPCATRAERTAAVTSVAREGMTSSVTAIGAGSLRFV